MTMDTPSTVVDAAVDYAAILTQRYHIEPIWYERAGISWDYVVKQRIPTDALAARESAGEARRSVRSEAGKGVRFARQAKATGDDPVALIQELAPDSTTYRDPGLPVKEILFRILLAGGNAPMTVQALYDEVMVWVRGGDGRVITPEVLQRTLTADQDYGFMPVD